MLSLRTGPASPALVVASPAENNALPAAHKLHALLGHYNSDDDSDDEADDERPEPPPASAPPPAAAVVVVVEPAHRPAAPPVEVTTPNTGTDEALVLHGKFFCQVLVDVCKLDGLHVPTNRFRFRPVSLS